MNFPSSTASQVSRRDNANVSLAVLIVDDDPGIRSSVSRILRQDGYRVDLAQTGKEALDRTNWSDYFAVLLDRRLPDTSADELLPQIRDLAPHSAVLIITGYADLQSSLAAIRAGAADYLLKPVDPAELRARLKRLAQLKQVRDELDERDRQIDFMIEHLPAGAAYVNPRTGQVRVNQTLERMTGYTRREQATLKQWFQTLFGDQAVSHFETYLADRAAGFPEPRVVTMRCKDGRQILGEFSGYAHTNHEVWLIHDVTERQRMQEELRQSERLAAIGQMVTGLAHESRNALQRARACLDMLTLDLEGQSQQLQLTARIQRALEELQRLYEEVRNYAAPIRLSLGLCDIAEIWRTAWRHVVQTHDGHSIMLAENVQTPDTRCVADRDRIDQVLRNVLENAAAVSPAGGTITVTCEERELRGVPALRLSITDEGPGLNEEQAERIFQPFYTTKQKGTGLGMAIAQRIIETHSGTIEAASRSEGGTTVFIMLPRQPERGPA